MVTRTGRWLARSITLLACALPVVASARHVETIADRVHLLRGSFVPGQQPDGNSVILRGDDAWIVVNSGRHAGHTQQLLDFAAQSKLPISDIVNTHWHLDHVSGNVAIRRIHPQVAVHASAAIDAALVGFLANYRQQLTDVIEQQPHSPDVPGWRAEIARIDSGASLTPTAPIKSSGRRELAGRDIDVHLAKAATDGDVWLFDRASQTLIAGDLVTLPVPFLDTACPALWRIALDEVDEVPFRQLVPGHGPVLSRAQFRRYGDAFGRLLDCANGDTEAAVCANHWIDDLGEVLPASEHERSRQLLDYYVSYRLRGPGATADCPLWWLDNYSGPLHRSP